MAEYAVGVPMEQAMSFEEFVATHGRLLAGFALMVTGNHADAQDAVQDALAGAYPRWNRISANGDPTAYVRRSIINRHISVYRKLHRLVAWGDRDVVTSDRAVEVAGRDWALRLVEQLPPRQRVAVVLRVLEDLDFPSVAEEMGVSEANARKLVSRGLAALRPLVTDAQEQDA